MSENPLEALVQEWNQAARLADDWHSAHIWKTCADALEFVLDSLPTFEIGD